MANASTNLVINERCWTLVGRRQGPVWCARRMRPTQGSPSRVGFDAGWVLQREESRGDILGFHHTHPSGAPSPSCRDDRTMRAWAGALGKPLLCLIEADNVVRAYRYYDDEHPAGGDRLPVCELLPPGIVIACESVVGWEIRDEETIDGWTASS